ncbi:MAG: oligopeptidase B [Elusimicrobia bacterium RIFOXYA12_FULL_51_18]|nr:MAG: oligopeptidase B [Elusimicrobia bacterium RIFOXYA12_FULL_51_18]OGS29712.1 MAG: oligopeptidase B [Elusimicrobia bacterium RIFOXYA2_FULL_53_38]
MLGLRGFAGAVEPPKAGQIPYKLEKHGDIRVDDYYWLRDRKDPKVIKYLEDENNYTDAALKHTEPLRSELFTEMKFRIKEDDSSVPFGYGGYYYYKKYEKGLEYPIYARKKGSLDAKEEILLDVNELAKGQAYCQVRFPSIRPDHKMIAFAVDTKGRRFYTVYFKDLDTGKVYEEKLPDTAGNMEWANDNKTLFYVKQDTETLRWNRVLRHELGFVKDPEVYFEPDETFELGISKSITDKYIFIRTGATLSTEYRLVDADKPGVEPVIFYPRQPKLEYDVEDGGGVFYITNNDNARNFKLSVCPADKTGKTDWTDLIPHRDDTLLENVAVFENWLVLKEQKDALGRLHIINRRSKEEHLVPFDEPAYTVALGENFEYKTDTVRFNYESMTTPESVYDYNMPARGRVLMKRQEVLGGFKPEDYVSERLWFSARDGEKVPMSIVYRKGLNLAAGNNPVFIYSYGSYGYSTDPDFSSLRLSLLDRGFIYAVPHIRGGSELGRRWYEDGRQLKKKNTFYDFIDATQYLIGRGFTNPGHIYAEGGSAGGLLMGAVLNMAPGLYNGVIAAVPFVDVLTTMLDPNIPLTTGEYDEWGNPNVKEYYDYIKSYSPYDNVEKKAYPNILVTTGLNDSQVQYWEPAKWVAKLRALKTDKNILLLKTDMDVGHGGKSGRFEAIKLVALEYAFVLDLEGIKK